MLYLFLSWNYLGDVCISGNALRKINEVLSRRASPLFLSSTLGTSSLGVAVYFALWIIGVDMGPTLHSNVLE